ncbi:hypothetical protein PS685_04479 [Pseudomonas fluorescens]|uniref:Uncharacterized protein n=1 Tax=Pseudomonas fluorescens TaxID=294 RepID=A0A5E6ZC51_PSEFL|nr:hypothetical protein PS685_04479 [Pseudomonas fluorescens]
MIEVEGVAAGLERSQGLADRGVVQGRQPQALDGAAVAAVLDQFAGNHLAFAVGVGGDDQFCGFTEQALDGLELAGGLGFDAHFPFFRNDRQVSQYPALVALIVGVGRGGFEQVTDAPGDGGIGAHPAAITAAAGTEHGGNIFGLGGFFTQKQPHRSTHSRIAEDAQHGQRQAREQVFLLLICTGFCRCCKTWGSWLACDAGEGGSQACRGHPFASKPAPTMEGGLATGQGIIARCRSGRTRHRR